MAQNKDTQKVDSVTKAKSRDYKEGQVQSKKRKVLA